ncbi:Mur ligase family protein [Mesorhizobium sp.]|uniref:Mur ligase family protein n=1 Tax=Mesorhizobium sp. TaxID=1871066 RepID=UPI0025F552E0|nr:Mur ligase family protein [Mesorhizobium sp.]
MALFRHYARGRAVMISLNPFAREGWLRSVSRPLRRELPNAIRRKLAASRARSNRRGHPATFIGITGSSGKTTTASLLGHVLEAHAPTTTQAIYNTAVDIAPAVASASRNSEFVVLEIGASKKGSVARSARLIEPDVAIVTIVDLEHYSVFRSLEAVADEKGWLVNAVRPGGFALLNADDEHVLAMRRRTRERIVTYGRDEGADFRVLSAEFSFPGPLRVRIAWKGNEETLVSPLPGKHFWLAVTAAFAAAVELGVSPEQIKERIAGFGGVPNRCQIMEVPHGPTFIVDAAKAPFGTIDLAFDVMSDATDRRRKVVIGQISDYAGNPYSKYTKAYQRARAVADEVIAVGDNAHKVRATEEDIASGRFHRFRDVYDVYAHLKKTAVEGDLILLKSSSSLHLERVALAWTSDVKCWEKRCGFTIGCVSCGLYSHPFHEHGRIRRREKRRRRREKIRRLVAAPFRLFRV